MAIHVEDHPIEYFDFEGVIPARQYGAGDVIVWDWGTWEAEAPTLDAAAAIEAGELKFRLAGREAQGPLHDRPDERPQAEGRRPARARSRTTPATSGCSSTSATSTPSPAGMPRTTRRASRPGEPTTTSRRRATPSGSGRRRRPPPRSTWPVPWRLRCRSRSSRCWRRSPRSRSATPIGCTRSSGTAFGSRPSSTTARSASGRGT